MEPLLHGHTIQENMGNVFTTTLFLCAIKQSTVFIFLIIKENPDHHVHNSSENGAPLREDNVNIEA